MLFFSACFPKNFAADGCNIMQEASECLEVTHSHPNFTLGNQFKEIMKREADAGNINDRRNHNRRGSSSKDAEIETYLSPQKILEFCIFQIINRIRMNKG